MIISKKNKEQICQMMSEALSEKAKSNGNVNWLSQFSQFGNVIKTLEGSMHKLTQDEIADNRRQAVEGYLLNMGDIDWSYYSDTKEHMSQIAGKLAALTMFCGTHDSRVLRKDDNDFDMKDNFYYVSEMADGSCSFDYPRELVALERYLYLTKTAYERNMSKEEM